MRRSAEFLATAARPLGVAFGAGMAALALLRHAKPIHPRGVTVEGTLEVERAQAALGDDLGEPRSRQVLVRVSRSAGLPDALPDVQGLALRWRGLAGTSDVLLSSTGLGPWTRYVLVPRRHLLTGPTTSIMPFLGPRGPVLLAAVPSAEPLVLELRWATPRGPWQRFGTLTLARRLDGAGDADVRFDPVLHLPAGLATYGWAASLRHLSYRWARRAWRTPASDLEVVESLVEAGR